MSLKRAYNGYRGYMGYKGYPKVGIPFLVVPAMRILTFLVVFIGDPPF